MSKIILTADDFGACDYIDSGIQIALKERRINSVAAFTCFPDSHDRIEKLIKFRRDEGLDFSIGLHFSVTSGFPLTDADSLRKVSDDKTSSFKEPEDFFDGNDYERADVTAELNEQIHFMEAVLHDAGYDEVTKQIDSVSNHHGVVYIDNNLFRDYVNTIEGYGIPIRSPQPWSKSKLHKRNIDRKILNPAVREGINLGFIQRLWSAPLTGKRVKIADESGLIFPYVLLDEFYGQPSRDYLKYLVDQYKNKKFASEFMFHLGDRFLRNTTDPDLLPGINFGYFDTRDKELAELLATDIPSLLQQNNVKLSTFRDLNVDDSLEPK